MRSYEKLIGLVEDAASSIKRLSGEDVSALKSLRRALNNIECRIGKIKDVPADILKEAKGASCDALKSLEKILKKEVKNTDKAIESVSCSILEIQKLIAHIDKSENTSAKTKTSEVKTKDSQTKTESSTESSETEKSSSQTTRSDTLPEETVVAADDVPLVLDFIAEANEHIEASEAGLLALESKPDDSETINLVFRAFHTIKGMAGFLNLIEIGLLAHSAENLLDLVRKGEAELSGVNINLVFNSIDMLKKMLGTLAEGIAAGKPVVCNGRLPKLIGKLKAAVDGKNLATSLNIKEGKQKEGKQKDAGLKNIFEETQKSSAAADAAAANAEEYKGTERRVTETADRRVAGEGDRRAAGSVDEKIKVSTSRLDKLVNMSGELVIAQLMVSEEVNTTLSPDHSLVSKVSHQNKLIRELQELSMSMRMVPIHGVFQKMARLVRDLSHKAGKNISLVTSGEETELDRSIVDKIADPLVHMIRNSVDHGIESSKERLQAGKDADGRINLRAFHQAGNIVIEIEDDGKGLNTERILQKAIDNGVVAKGQDLTSDEICKLIFHAGLSTAQKVTSVSGRGVGMDVVKKNIESLRGKVDISTTVGKGTVFTISLPLTLAIIDGQIVRIGKERYIIPITSIESSLRPTIEQISTVQNSGEMAMIRNELIPIVRLYELFDVKPDSNKPNESSLVVVEEDNNRCCLLVDELLGQQQVVIKSLGDGIGRVTGISGGSIMGDGRVSLIVDIPGLIELSRR